jgi:hypothetical protein
MLYKELSRYNDEILAGRQGFDSRWDQRLSFLSVQTGSLPTVKLAPSSNADVKNSEAVPPLSHASSWPNA